jgi:hypothetical protein
MHFSRDWNQPEHPVLVQFGVHIVRHLPDCGYPDVFRAFCFHHDDDGGAALSRVVELEISLACVSEDPPGV